MMCSYGDVEGLASITPLVCAYTASPSKRNRAALADHLNHAIKRGHPEAAALCATALRPLTSARFVDLAIRARRPGILATVFATTAPEVLKDALETAINQRSRCDVTLLELAQREIVECADQVAAWLVMAGPAELERTTFLLCQASLGLSLARGDGGPGGGTALRLGSRPRRLVCGFLRAESFSELVMPSIMSVLEYTHHAPIGVGRDIY
mmetsp:Transcript_12039/g.21399  ORF Transcript_12039/g.21399 Transcript_12039/m.21399 type:complete len:210 (+) Transcript_12039:61-690(+)